jgi:hypothetical protein
VLCALDTLLRSANREGIAGLKNSLRDPLWTVQ